MALAVLLLTVCAGVRPAAASPATSVMLAWDPSPSPGVSGYRVHRGILSGFYTSVTDVGNSTSILMPDLSPGISYFFAITAYDASGQESGFSNEAVYTPMVVSQPATPTMKLSLSVEDGVRLTAAGPAGRTYDLLASENLKDWGVISVVTLGGDGRLEFYDPEAARYPARFYRARETQPAVQLRVVPGGQLTLTVTGQNSRTYDVLASANLVQWTVIGAVTLGTSGRVDFVDAAAANYPARFYRTRERQL